MDKIAFYFDRQEAEDLIMAIAAKVKRCAMNAHIGGQAEEAKRQIELARKITLAMAAAPREDTSL